MTKYEVGKTVKCTVTGIESYGAFVSLDEYYTGLIHISEISKGFVNNIEDYLNVGDHIYAKIIGIDEEQNHLKLSIKDIKYRIKGKMARRKIKETGSGFGILKKMLPIWVNNKLQ